MTRTLKIILTVAGVAFAATAASAAYAQATTAGDQSTPNSFNWEIKDGKRVPKGQRKVNADGSWREEIRQGKCVTVRKSPRRANIKKPAAAIKSRQSGTLMGTYSRLIRPRSLD
jgi:hypothetical protein